MARYDVWVDFHEVDSGDTVTTLRRFATIAPGVGDRVTIGDDEGNSAKATVRSIDDSFVVLAVDWESFEAVEGWANV